MIEEDRPRVCLSQMVVAHLPGEHQFRKEDAVCPGKSRASDIHLILDDAAASFDAARVAAALEGVDERAFPEPGPPVRTKKWSALRTKTFLLSFVSDVDACDVKFGQTDASRTCPSEVTLEPVFVG